MDIKFLEILPKTGKYIIALFKVGDKKVKISITNTLRIIWGINPYGEVKLALKQIGKLKIRLMIATNKDLEDYMFQTYDFKKDNHTLSFGDVVKKLENKILEAEEEQDRIGF